MLIRQESVNKTIWFEDVFEFVQTLGISMIKNSRAVFGWWNRNLIKPFRQQMSWFSGEIRKRLMEGYWESVAWSDWMKCRPVTSFSLTPRQVFLISGGYPQPWYPKPLPFHSPQISWCLGSMDRSITRSFNSHSFNNVNSFNKVNSFNNVSFNTTINDDQAQVLQWLSSLEPQKRHQHLRESRLEGVGEWIFRASEFQRWNTGEDGSAHSVLFCHGDPGVGKTHLR